MRRVTRTIVTGGALLLSALAPAEASWFRNTVSATLTAKGGLDVTSPFGPPVMVGPGTEFTGRMFHPTEGLGFDVAVDVDSYEIVVSFAASHATPLVDPAGLVDITLSGLAPQRRILLTSFSCPSPGGACYWPDSAPEASLADNLPTELVLGFTALRDGASYVYAIPIPNAVPAPGGWALTATGLLGLAWAAGLRGTGLRAAPLRG